MEQFLLGLLAGIGIAYLAYRARTLNRSGAVSAAVLGAIIFGLGGLPWAVLLLAFFISSSVLSRAFSLRKRSVDEKYSKGSRRDAGQVLANGGVAGLLVMLYLVFSRWLPAYAFLAWLAFTASLAAANADTWATELGILNPSPPVLITNGRRVEPGTSGGISLVGSLAALGGSALITGLAWLMQVFGTGPAAAANGNNPAYLLVLAAGLIGSFIDSFLGATIQAIYFCPSCRKETERHPLHTCGTPTVLKRGLPWLDNAWVNTACTLSAAALVMIIGLANPSWMVKSIPAQIVFPQIIVQGGTPMPLILAISAFPNGGNIPKDYTCDGANRSPAITWSGVPAAARSLALIVNDPDAPVGTFTHWVLYNLPPELTGLAASQPKTAALPGIGVQGSNDFRRTGFDGPCPPPGKPHRYFFRLYALDEDPILADGLDAARLQKEMQGHILTQGEWMGKYGR